MATIGDPHTNLIGKGADTRPDTGRYRWSKREFYRLDQMGFFRDRRVELLGGEIFLMTIKPPHCVAVGLTTDALKAAFGAGYYVRAQGVLDIGGRSLPQPDVAVFPGTDRDYTEHHPRTALLLVEVSESSLRFDRTRKLRRYARAGIADYWILNLIDRRLEIYRDPGPDPSHAEWFLYHHTTVVPATGHVSPLALPGAVIAVADCLP